MAGSVPTVSASKSDEKVKLEIKPKEPEKPPERKRGRPPKPAPLTWEQFKHDALCKAVDSIIVNVINSTILRDKPKKLTDTQVGSALMYSVYYYTKFRPEHPIFILGLAMTKTAADVLSCIRSKPEGVKSAEG